MKKRNVIITCLIVIVLVFIFRPRSINSIIFDGKINNDIEIVSIKIIDKSQVEMVNLNDYDTSRITNDIGIMSVMPYPWGRGMEVEVDKPYYIVRLLVNDEEVFVDVYSNQIGVASDNYWVLKKELMYFELDNYKIK